MGSLPISRYLPVLSDVDEFFHLPHIVKPGETISSTDFTRKAGGKGANQAYAVARAGGSVDLDGCVGKDGTWIRDLLHEAGLGSDKLKVIEEQVSRTKELFDMRGLTIVAYRTSNHPKFGRWGE